jgi:predicted dehydrogenase
MVYCILDFPLSQAPHRSKDRVHSPGKDGHSGQFSKGVTVEHKIGIIMNGVTGREGTHQHLVGSILPLRAQGGVPLPNGDVIMPDPILVGRNTAKLAELARRYGIGRYTTDLDAVLADPSYPIFFDSTLTGLRPPMVRKAIAAGKALYVEKPTAATSGEAVALYREASAKGLKNGVVQDKVLYPGLQKLKYLIETGYFGEILSVRGDFGYWIFDGFNWPCQRSSWNHRVADGGGMILDMYPHWSYIIGDLFGDVRRTFTVAKTCTKRRVDEEGREYACDADDTAYSLFELENGLVVQWHSSWAVRVHRRDLWALQVDGTRGSAVAGMFECHTLSDAQTPRPIWSPDISPVIDYLGLWSAMPNRRAYDNANKTQWELFLKHVVLDTPFPWNLLVGAKGVQLAEKSMLSAREGRWVDLEQLV